MLASDVLAPKLKVPAEPLRMAMPSDVFVKLVVPLKV